MDHICYTFICFHYIDMLFYLCKSTAQVEKSYSDYHIRTNCIHLFHWCVNRDWHFSGQESPTNQTKITLIKILASQGAVKTLIASQYSDQMAAIYNFSFRYFIALPFVLFYISYSTQEHSHVLSLLSLHPRPRRNMYTIVSWMTVHW